MLRYHFHARLIAKWYALVASGRTGIKDDYQQEKPSTSITLNAFTNCCLQISESQWIKFWLNWVFRMEVCTTSSLSICNAEKVGLSDIGREFFGNVIYTFVPRYVFKYIWLFCAKVYH